MGDNRSRLRNLVLACAVAAVLLLTLGAILLAWGASLECRDCNETPALMLLTLGFGSLVLGAFAALGAVLSIAQYARSLGKFEGGA